MSGTGRTSYQATYRATEIALPGLLGLLAIFAGGVFIAFKVGDGDLIIKATLWLAAFVVFGALATLLVCFRVHRWSVGAEGVEIVERPKVPLAGFSRRAAIGFGDIAALARIESGLDRLIEIVARDGRRFRMPQAMLSDPRGLGVSDPAQSLDAFAASLCAAAEQSGRPLPETEALSFWNTVAGIVCLAVMFLLSLAIAAAVGWALLDGGLKPQPKGGQATAILILLPFGAGWLLLKALRRRRAVLKRAPIGPGPGPAP